MNVLQGKSPAVCAVVVAFHPDADFQDRLKILQPQVDALLVIDNTPPLERRSSIEVAADANLQACVIENTDNIGVAAALNQGLDYALQQGCEWLLTLDQDSLCHEDMVSTLLAVKVACEPPPAVIGSNYYDARNRVAKVPAGIGAEYLDQKTVITSGSLVNVGFARSIGGFREDYFIDQLDHEFCLRSRAHGGRVVISRKPVMDHSVGEASGARLPLLGQLPGHSPLRKYYIARNSLVTIAAHWRSEPDWCMRRALRLALGLCLMVVLERQRLPKVRAFFAGVADALAGRMGCCCRNWLLSG